MKRQMTLCLCLLSICQSLQAHPHSWVGLTTDFIINSSGELDEIRQRWIFDPYYSTLTIDDLKKTHESLEVGLVEHSNGIINNLESHSYYSHLTIGDNSLTIKRPSKFHLSSVPIEQDTLLILEMHFDIDNISMQAADLQWQVYDPTYYVSMRHDSINQVRLYNSSALECEPSIIEPDPDEELFDYAASLDITQTESTGLGEFFAQTISLKCY